jgi:hypothetical protein
MIPQNNTTVSLIANQNDIAETSNKDIITIIKELSFVYNILKL